jgi:hypothetical protein
MVRDLGEVMYDSFDEVPDSIAALGFRDDG